MKSQENNKKIPVLSPSGKRGLLVILGGGESGVGTAILGKQKGYQVFVSDKGTIAKKYKEVLLHNEINFEENQHTESKILNADVVMKSPGIPDKVALVQKLIENKTPVISEIEFAAQFTDANIVAITGSNGKTTTTLLTYHILKNAGLNGGYILSSSNTIHSGVKVENFLKMVSSAKKYGKYPLNLHSL